MKSRFLLLFALAVATPASRAAIVYSGVQDFPIPFDLEGSYLRIDTGATAVALPGDWTTAPWINPYFGGVKIANSPLLRPVITGSSQILNLTVGTVIDGTNNFALGESGSETHFGLGAGQFALNVPGYMGVTFRSTAAGAANVPRKFVFIKNRAHPRMLSTTAHEIGHLFGLEHSDDKKLRNGQDNPTFHLGSDPMKRLMYSESEAADPTFLFKPEWDIVNKDL